MRFFITTALVAFATIAQGAPATSEKPKSPLEKRSTAINDCGNSSFENHTSGGSPLVSDCQTMARNIAGGGTFTTGCGPQRQLVQFGTCAFGVQTHNGCTVFKVGNQDIIDLVHGSINRFASGGKVGSSGTMPCQTLDGHATVVWGLYHN